MREALWLADDSPLQGERIAAALASFFEVRVFCDPTELLESLVTKRLKRPALLLLDSNMPLMSGVEVCRAVRLHHDKLTLPILVLTSDSAAQDRAVEALDAGANDFMSAPYAESELIARVRSLHDLSLLANERMLLLEEIQIAKAQADQERNRAERANAAKDHFLATVSHELRTPLNAVLGWTQLARKRTAESSAGSGSSSADLERMLATIDRNARAQQRLIEDILDMNRVVSGKMRLELAPTNLTATLNAAVEAIRPSTVTKGIRFEVHVPPSLPIIAADANRLQQVVWNLLSNAVKFTDGGGTVSLEAAIANDDDDDGNEDRRSLQIAVTDSGKGISPDILPHVFDRFVQVDGSSRRSEGGLGLGLAIVKQLVEAHAGTVMATSEIGSGSRFTITIPAKLASPVGVASGDERPKSENAKERDPANAANAGPSPSPAPSSQTNLESAASSLRGLTALIVEDDRDSRELLVELLGSVGLVTIPADSALTGLKAFHDRRPDVIVSDIGMKHVDGLSFIRRIRALSPSDGGRIPAVALTAFTTAGDVAAALEAGFQRHLTKPLDAPTLIQALVEVLTVTAR